MRGAFCAAVLFSALEARADQCSFIARAGGKVSMRSGKCSGTGEADAEKKQGRERCVDEAGAQLSELGYRNGKLDGKGFYTDYNDQRLEGTFREGLAEGPFLVRDKAGKLLCELKFVGGKAQGAARELYPSGKLRQAWRFVDGAETEDGRLELLESGKVKDVKCAAGQSVVPEDRAVCGYGGKTVEVALWNSETERRAFTPTYKDGVLVATVGRSRRGLQETKRYSSKDAFDAEVRDEKGVVRERYSERQGRLDGPLRLYAASGQARVEVEFRQGKPSSAKHFFLNGKLEWEISEREGKLLRREYDDLGTLVREGTYAKGQPRLEAEDFRWWLDEPQGLHTSWRSDKTLALKTAHVDGQRHGVEQAFFRSGKLAVERRFEKGRLVREECFSPQGARELVEEFFEDGSRKTADPASEQKRRDGACDAER